MAITLTWPLTSDGAGAVTYTANNWRTLLTNLFSEGILGSDSFEVSERAAGANMTLDVTAGVAVLEGDDAAGQGNYLVEASETLGAFTIDTADATNPRIDRVGIQLNDPSEGGSSGRNSTFVVVKGTAAASPSAPTLPDSFLELAQVTVPAGATSIEDADITDTRELANLTHQDQVGETAATADTVVRRDESSRIRVADPTSTNHAANKQWVDAQLLPAGSTLDSGKIIYRKVADMVHVWTTSAGSTGSVSLPAGYRPSATIAAPCNSLANGPGNVAISSAGAITVTLNSGSGAAVFAVSFLAA
jgi:hypothetical protein